MLHLAHFIIDLQRTLRQVARQTTIIGARESDNPCDLGTKGLELEHLLYVLETSNKNTLFGYSKVKLAYRLSIVPHETRISFIQTMDHNLNHIFNT